MISDITPTLIIKCLKCRKDKAATLSDGCVRLDASLRSRWILCSPCAPPFGFLPRELQKTHLPNISDGKLLCRLLFKYLLFDAISERSEESVQGWVFPPRRDQATEAATAEVRTEVNVSAKVSWCTFLCLTLCLPQFKLPYMQLYQIKWYIW